MNTAEIVDTVIDIGQGLAVIVGLVVAIAWFMAWMNFLTDDGSDWSGRWLAFLLGPLALLMVGVAWMIGRGF